MREQRGGPNQLAVALQLGALRWLGFVPEDLAAAPPDTLAALAETLDVPARAIFDYAVRAQTRGEHRLLVRAYAGFRPFGEREIGALGGRFVDAALEHERSSLLLVRLCEILTAERIERPSVDRLVRLVGWARERAHERTFERLAPQLDEQVRTQLDGLLLTEDGRCGHAWLRARPSSVSARALSRELEKRSFLIGELGADRFDLRKLPPNRRAWLAQTGRQQTNQALSRMAPERRYPVLMAFAWRRSSVRPTMPSRSTTGLSAVLTERRSAGERSSSAAAAATPKQRSVDSSISPASCWKLMIRVAMPCG